MVPMVEGKNRTKHIPIQVTTIQLTKDNYLSWPTTIIIGIAGCGKHGYIAGTLTLTARTNPTWANWFLDDNQVKMRIVNFVSPDIQPLIFQKQI